MEKRRKGSTKSIIIEAAWELFYEQGYDETTVDQIIEKSATSKGSFYHYFNSKDELLSTLSTLWDDKYEELKQQFSDDMNSFDKLLFLNKELFTMIDNSIDEELLASLYSSQLTTKGQVHLLDQNRIYYQLLNEIVFEGQQKGELTKDFSPFEITKMYALLERAFIYDWCMCQGRYSLAEYSVKWMPLLLDKIRA